MKGSEGSQILALDLDSMEYRPVRKPASGSLEAAKLAKGAKAKTKALLAGGDRYADFAWDVLKQVLLYSAEKVGEIADSIREIDEAMKWGFNWELGPFETWDAVGLPRSVARMEAEGLSIPAWVKDWLAQGNETFYKKESGVLFQASGLKYKQVDIPPERISCESLKSRTRSLKRTAERA